MRSNTQKNKNYLSIRTLRKNNIELVAPNEEFAQIKKWDTYFISNYGRLIHKNHKGRFSIVNPSITGFGYLKYTLSKPARKYKGKKVRDKNGVPKQRRNTYQAHRLVAQLFVNSRYPDQYSIEDLEVHHIDEDPGNNYSENLIYLTKEDHDLVHSIKKISHYNVETTKFYGYKNIEKLIDRTEVTPLEFFDCLRNNKTFKQGEYNMYCINGHFIGVQFRNNSK